MGVRWHPEEIIFLPDGSDSRMRRLSYTGPGAVLVAVEHDRAEEAGRRWLGDLRVRHRPALTLWQSSRGAAHKGGQVIELASGARLVVCSDARTRRTREVNAPLRFVYGNCVFADGLDDCWAAFTLEVSSYQWLSEDGKRAQFLALLGALEATEADVQILRVGRRWELQRYADEVHGVSELLEGDAESVNGIYHSDSATACARARTRVRTRYVQEHQRRLKDIGKARPVVFLIVSLRDPERDVASYVSRVAEQHPRDWWEGVRRAFSARDRRLLRVSDLERARVRADQAHARLADFLPVRQARGVEVQWLVRRAFCRGLGEPLLDELHEPRALMFERNGEAMLAPLEGDVMRWMDGFVEHRGRVLKVESELGTSWQAQLVVGALPGAASVSGGRVPS